MLQGTPGEVIQPVLAHRPPLLDGLSVGIRTQPSGIYVVALSSADVVETEIDDARSTYTAYVTIPPDADTAVAHEIVWSSTAGIEATETLDLTPDGDERLTATVADVAALLQARTYADDEYQGTFNDATTPTGEQVEALITIAAGDLATRVGTTIPDLWLDEAKRLIALQAATLVEASYFPSELDSDASAFRQYQAMYLNGVEQLTGAARRPGAMRLA